MHFPEFINNYGILRKYTNIVIPSRKIKAEEIYNTPLFKSKNFKFHVLTNESHVLELKKKGFENALNLDLERYLKKLPQTEWVYFEFGQKML